MIVSTNEKSVRITSAKRYKIFVSSDKGCSRNFVSRFYHSNFSVSVLMIFLCQASNFPQLHWMFHRMWLQFSTTRQSPLRSNLYSNSAAKPSPLLCVNIRSSPHHSDSKSQLNSSSFGKLYLGCLDPSGHESYPDSEQSSGHTEPQIHAARPGQLAE